MATMTVGAGAAFVFVGPTLRPDDLGGFPEIAPLPPAGQGDIYRVASQNPLAIGLIDGYFDSVPAVWHKEILWAMAQGIHVFGGASMGALRAAELAAFGMSGVGKIFEHYLDGTIQDDDDVAVLHGPPDTGFLPLSEAMVNIRATLAQAVRAGVISPATRERLESIAKATFYQERTWSNLLAGAAATGLPSPELVPLQTWLRTGRVDQKREDALAMLGAMWEFLAASPEAKRIDFHFEWTDTWDEFVRSSAPTVPEDGSGDFGVPVSAILEELRLKGQDFSALRRRALARVLGLRECSRRRLAAKPESVRTLRERLRMRFGLFAQAQLDAWAAGNGLDVAGLERLIAEEAMIGSLEAAAGADLDRQILDELRLTGDYAVLASRALDKATVLQAAGHGVDAPDSEPPVPAALLPWHFERKLGQSVPNDPAAYALGLGFADLADFHRALRKEWLYFHIKASRDEG